MANVLATPYAGCRDRGHEPGQLDGGAAGFIDRQRHAVHVRRRDGAVATAGVPVGSSAFSCLVNVGAAGTVVIQTIGTAADVTYEEQTRSSRS